MNPTPHSRSGQTEAIEATAAAWLARQDKGLTPDEQAEFALWRFSDPAHTVAVDRLNRAWVTLDQLRDFRPEAQTHPDKDLLATQRPAKIVAWPLLTGSLAAAAAVMLGLSLWTQPAAEAPYHRKAIIHPGAERLTLEDGSVVELNTGARVDVQFTPNERHVQLVQGEAHFNVAKNPARPFTVTAGRVSVRAVGTAFSVALGRTQVSVLVTEGTVKVNEVPAGPNAATARELSQLIAGQRIVVAAESAPAGAATVTEMTPAEIERACSWQAMRLEFADMPLGDVVAEFNRYNRQPLTVGDPATAGILVGGTFRADNAEAFVRLLEASFGLTVSRRDGAIILRQAR